MNKFMYVGLILGLIVSIILVKIYDYNDPSMVTIVSCVIGTFMGAAFDNLFKEKDDVEI